MAIGIRAEYLRKTYTSPRRLRRPDAGSACASVDSADRRQKYVAITLLVACLAASVGLVLGTSVGQTQIGLMFSLVLAPMIFFGCAYYPWSSLASFPVLQKVVLVNPMVYASEGFRSALVPRFPHLPKMAIFGALVSFDTIFLAFGLRQFRRKAVG